jgi:NitT/TauT family transport system ATP-binding protein
VLLADRVCVFGPRPGRIIREVAVPFARPRDQSNRRSPEYLALVEEISELLYSPETITTTAALAGGAK